MDFFGTFLLGSLFGGENVGRILKTPGMILDERSARVFPHTFYSRFNIFNIFIKNV